MPDPEIVPPDQLASAPLRTIEGGVATPSRSVERPMLPPDPALVSCLMVTGTRPRRAATAIECFRHQSYPNRELVIIDDGPTEALARHVATLDDARIRLIRLPARDQSLGELRNVAVDHAAGSLVCQWDDDDLSDPERLWWQAGLLTIEPTLDACFLERWIMLWTDGPRLAVGTRRLWEGSMVARVAALPAYPSQRRGEDSVVAEAMIAAGRVALLDLPQLYVYLVHGSNTFEASHFDAHWQAASQRFPDPAAALAQLDRRVPLRQSLRN